MRYPQVKVFIAVSISLFLAACSSSLTRDEDSPDEPAETADAGTDALPPPDAENPAPPKDAADAPPPPPAPEAAPSAAPVADVPPPPPPPAPVADAPAPVPPPAPVAAAPETPASPAPAPATPAPAPAAPATTDSGTGGSDTYVVKRGDTLMKIAYETCGDLEKWHNLFDMNRGQISNPNRIEPGQTLKVEKCSSGNPGGNGEKYLIRQGDTLGKISDSLYGTPGRWKELWHKNGQLIKNPNRIFAGFYLYYDPSGAHADAGGNGGGGGGASPQPTTDSAQAAPPADMGGGPGPASIQAPVTPAAPVAAAPVSPGTPPAAPPAPPAVGGGPVAPNAAK